MINQNRRKTRKMKGGGGTFSSVKKSSPKSSPKGSPKGSRKKTVSFSPNTKAPSSPKSTKKQKPSNNSKKQIRIDKANVRLNTKTLAQQLEEDIRQLAEKKRRSASGGRKTRKTRKIKK